MNPETEQGIKLVRAVSEAIVDVLIECPDGAPGGIIYVVLQHLGIDYHGYSKIMGALLDAGVIELRHERYYYAKPSGI